MSCHRFLSGVDMVLIVAEPSISGISDMDRIIKTAQRFRTKIGVCTNKYDTNLANTQKIESFCAERGLPFVGRIPFDSGGGEGGQPRADRCGCPLLFGVGG